MQRQLTCRIPLANRQGEVIAHAIVDLRDHEALSRHRWHRHKDGYAATNIKVDGRYRTRLMHRVILSLDRGRAQQADHVNGDKLDNRRENLRVVTGAQNAQNVSGNRAATSTYRGVGWDKQAGRWRARVAPPGNQRRAVFLGYFDTETEAALAASEYRRQHLPFTVEERTGLCTSP